MNLVKGGETTPLELDYAPRPALHRRRGVRRALWLTAFLVFGLAAWQLGPPYARQARYLYWQSRSMSFRAPTEHVAYEEDPNLAVALVTQPGYQPVSSFSTPSGTQRPVGFVPPPLSRLSGNWVCMAFVGGRKSAGGQRRLVTLGYQVHKHPAGRVFDLYGSGKTLATLSPGSQIQGSGLGIQFVLKTQDSLRLYWGQRDPKQADRFTVRYTLNGTEGFIDGRLLEDGRLELNVRDGPLASPPR
jgi:hypothetical protein